MNLVVTDILAYLPASQVLHAPCYLEAPADQVLGVDGSQTTAVVPSVAVPPLMLPR